MSSNQIDAVYKQIEEICRQFRIIRQETKSIFVDSHISDATLQLNDVLASTEEATVKILNAATSIAMSMEGEPLSDQVRDKINSDIGLIYESCSFQDLSGQRIRKVMGYINDLGYKLERLSEDVKSGRIYDEEERQKDALLNGPALSGSGPSQDEIDRLFSVES